MHNKHMGELCVYTAKKYKISRKQQDAFAFQSHQRAVAARNKFKKEIVRVNNKDVDEHPRSDTTLATLAQLPAVFGNMITAGNASGLNDGAAAVVVMSEKEAKKRKVEERVEGKREKAEEKVKGRVKRETDVKENK